MPHQLWVVEAVHAEPVTVAVEHLIGGAVGEDDGEDMKRVPVPWQADIANGATHFGKSLGSRTDQLVDLLPRAGLVEALGDDAHPQAVNVTGERGPVVDLRQVDTLAGIPAVGWGAWRSPSVLEFSFSASTVIIDG